MMRVLVLTFLSVTLNASLAHAWNVNTCNGHISGMRTKRGFTADLCNIPTNSQRYADVLYAFNEWNKIEGVADRFELVNGDSDCQIETDDAIAFVNSADIQGKAGLTRWTRKRCGPLDNTESDGRYIDIKIYIATDRVLGPSNPRSTGQNARNVLFHEMGHALGGEHDLNKPNMLWDPSDGPRTGDMDHLGNDFNHADGFLPDDVNMGVRWHNASGSGGFDIAVTGQKWNNSLGEPENQNSGTLLLCRGQVGTVVIGHMNKGKKPVPKNAPFQARLVASHDTWIGTEDITLATLVVWADQGAMWVGNQNFTVPQTLLPDTEWNIGYIVDPANAVTETDETNNSIDLGINLYIASGCKGGAL